MTGPADRVGQRAGRQHRPRLRQGARRPGRVRRVPPPAVPLADRPGGLGLRQRPQGPARVGGDGTDLVSILANRMPEDGVPLCQQDFNNYFSLLVIAGNETTRHSISNSMVGLIENPDQLADLQENPDLDRRRRSRSCCAGRRRSTTSGGPPRATWSSAASRSRRATRSSCGSARATVTTSVFEDPYSLDVTRTNVDHMTFGKGSPHLCLGNNLARMEIRLMFEELLPAARGDRLRRRRPPGALQLRQRHQGVPRDDDPGLTSVL